MHEPTTDGTVVRRTGGLTPRQARRVRAITAGVAMLAVGVGMVLQLSRQPSLVTLGLYGAALTISGTAIMLSRIGRTRVAMAVLAAAVVLVVAVDPLLR
ncbi:hypothetical protein SRB5_48850 [Streptomyces sp. RB5]|uniref:Uncharacterized protein n=1 Tax=Streptomyces smaragdinus TaxID=2585196 RepID=A0A7K0CMK0_9ACTN|nr:hypothetical protein [Streptomyces smaragdinus]